MKRKMKKTLAFLMAAVLTAGVTVNMPKKVKGDSNDSGTNPESTTETPVENSTPEADFKIASKTLVLSSGISLVFKVNKSLFEDRYSEPRLVVILDGFETVITEYTDEGSRYAFEFTKITPDKMNVMVEATLHATKNGKEYVSPVVEYSVATYAYNMLNKYGETPGMEKLRALLVDLLNYGAASQNYTGFNTDHPANSELTATQRNWGRTDYGTLTSVKNNNYFTINNPSVLWKTAGLALQDAVIVRMKFQTESINGLIVRVTDDYGTAWDIEPEHFEPAAGTDNQYYVNFKGFNVGRMSESMYFTVYRDGTPVSNTYRYSVESYVYAHYQDNNALASLVTAMIKYGKSASAFISNDEQSTTEPAETTAEQTTSPAEVTTTEIASKPANEEPTVAEVTKTVSESSIDATVTFSQNGAALSGKNTSGISVSTDSVTSTRTVSITKVGIYKLTGTTTNTVVDVKKSLRGNVEIILDNLTVDNSTYAQMKGSDSPVIAIGKETSVVIDLIGENTLIGSSTFRSVPEAIISQKGTTPTLTVYNAGNGILNITDSMPVSTNYGDSDPSDGIATKGELILKSGVLNVTVNGDALKGTGDTGTGGVTIENGTYNLQSMKSSAIKSKNGIITISGGTINSNYTADDAIKATNYDIGISGGTVNVNNCYSDGIQADWVTISGGYVDVNTCFENAGLNYYNSELPVHNSMDVTVGGNEHVLNETVNIDTGSHTGIKAGTKASKYKYLSVASGSSNAAGVTYTKPATGGVIISGGTVCVDTTNTGIKYNVKKSEGQYTGNLSFANNDGQYIIGSPGDGIESNNNFEISGGTVFVKSADDGITTAGTLTITGDSVVNVEQAYEGIEASAIVVGTNGSNSMAPYVSVYTINDGINAAVKSITTYIYTDETESSYSKTSESIMANNDMTVYSGTVIVMIADDMTHTFSLPVADGQGVVPVGIVTGTYTADGDGIDCNGSLYAYGGTIVVWGANSNKNSPIDTGDNNASYVIGAGATVIATARSDSKKNYPTSLGQNAVEFSGLSIASGQAFAILNSGGNMSVAAKAPKGNTYIFYSAPNLSGTYTLSSGGTVSGKINNHSIHDGRYNTYSATGASALGTSVASAGMAG